MTLSTANSRVRNSVAFLSLLLLSAIAKYQVEADGDNSYLYDWKLAVLGQKIGLDHPAFDARLSPAEQHDVLVKDAGYAAADKIGPYGKGWLHDAGTVKFDPGRVDTTLCDGFLETTARDDIGAISYGWAVANQEGRKSLLILLVDGTQHTVGYGVTGMSRPDVRKAVQGAPRLSGWTAFTQRVDGPLNAYVYTEGKFCPLHKLN